MATITIFTGDTVRIQGTFTDLEEVPVDADGDVVEFKVYNAETRAVLETDVATRVDDGIYYADWTAPDTEQSYFLELGGLFSTKPQLKRIKVKTKFKG